jgi:hypothetical protein
MKRRGERRVGMAKRCCGWGLFFELFRDPWDVFLELFDVFDVFDFFELFRLFILHCGT